MGSAPQSTSRSQDDSLYLPQLSRRAAAKLKEKDRREIEKILETKVVSTSNLAREIENHIVDKPHLQQRLADLVNYSPSQWLLEQELLLVRERRQVHTPATRAEVEIEDVYKWAHQNRLTGLCFSGGGIRSATLNLGILQGLAERNVLQNFDYLSSVSGGGYIHEWFAAWIKREEEERKGQPDYLKGDGFREVKKRLVPQPYAGQDCPAQPEPIRWLRRYSNYLTPQKGLLTGDTWVAVAIWLRNTFLNQAVLVSGLFLLLTFPHLIHEFLCSLPKVCSVPLSIALFLVATTTIFVELLHEYQRIKALDVGRDHERKHEPRRRCGGEKTIQALVVLPLLLAGAIHTEILNSCFPNANWYDPENILVFVLLWVFIAGAAAAGGSVQTYIALHEIRDGEDSPEYQSANLWNRLKDKTHRRVLGNKITDNVRIAVSGVGGLVMLTATLSAFTGTLFFVGVRFLLHSSRPAWIPTSYLGGPPDGTFQIVFGPALLLAVPFFTLVIAAGLVGRDFPDWLREWLARVRAWALLAGFGWAFLFGICLIGPFVVHWLETSSKLWLPATAAWLGTTAGSVFAGKSKKTGDKLGTTLRPILGLDLLAKIGAYVFIVGLLLVLSIAVEFSLLYCCTTWKDQWFAVVLPLVIFLILGWRVDINEFSMNPFYRNRLTRCYLGASNSYRAPNPLTGFDDRDTRGMQIAELTPTGSRDGTPYTGPLPLVCATVNLSFGEDLAWQERKAASFVFGPAYSGYYVGWTAGKPRTPLNCCGFVPTRDYAVPDGGINIATAVAISGAAASPNMGFHTDPATAFLMAMFNVRLGWWLPNPRAYKAKDCGSPRFAPIALIRELLGMVNDTSKFVYLSDGGHFENMGLYELVRRRCYRIVVCDSEQDENYFFEGIGNAIRKCRIDFGVEIDLDLSKLRRAQATGNSAAHFAMGTIRYPETPPDGPAGTILYIKSSLTGPSKYPITENWNVDLPVEPIDVVNYKFTHEHFPHDTTADQWFTESQFESYRRLGYHIVGEIKDCNVWDAFSH